MFYFILPIVVFYVFYEIKQYKNDNDFPILLINIFFLTSASILSYIIQFNVIDLPGVASIVNLIGEKVLSILNY